MDDADDRLGQRRPERAGAELARQTLLATGLTADGNPHFLATDKRTGSRLAQVSTPAEGEYGLMTYVHEDKQYVVLPVAGGYVAVVLP